MLWQKTAKRILPISIHQRLLIISLSPGRCGSHFNIVIFKLNLQINIVIIYQQIFRRWLPQNFTDD